MVLKKIQHAAKIAQKKYKEIIVEAQENNLNNTIAHIEPPQKEKSEQPPIIFSLTNIAKVVLVALLLVVLKDFLAATSDILILFLVSMLFAAALAPTVDKLEKYKIPRGVSVGIIMLLILAMISLFVYSMIPLLSTQLLDLGSRVGIFLENLSNGTLNIPEFLQPYVEDFVKEIQGTNFTATLQSQLFNYSRELSSLAGNVFTTLISISNGLANFLIVLVLTYFMSVDEKEIDKFILRISPEKYGTYITAKTNNIKQKVGDWLRGQLILMFVVGASTYLGLILLGTDYAFTLALIAGVTEVVPVIGPWLGLIAAIPIAINQGGSMIIWVTLLYFMVQRLENNLFVPVIMKKATGLNPIAVILAMLIGNKFLGIVGIIISIPMMAILNIFVEDLLIRKEQASKNSKQISEITSSKSI